MRAGSDVEFHEETVHVFRTWRNVNAAARWQPGPQLQVLVAADGGAAPVQLSWLGQDGAECAVAFAPDMTTCCGHIRTATGHLVQLQGKLDDRERLSEARAFRGYEFDTETLEVRWHPAGRLRLLVDDGAKIRPRWVNWRDQVGTVYSVGLWSGESEVFAGYRQPAGRAPVAYRGTQVPVGSSAGSESATPGRFRAAPPLLPPATSVPLVRTDFSDDETWAAVSGEVTAARHLSGGNIFTADVAPVEYVSFDGVAPAQLCRLVPPGAEWSFLLVADRTTMTSEAHSVLVVDLDADNLGRTFRAAPQAIQEIENCLSLGTMNWDDFASAAEDGVVRPLLS